MPGGTFFLTTTLWNRDSTLLVDRIEEVRAALRYATKTHPTSVIAMVVLPDHLHEIWQLPEGDGNFSIRMQAFKARLSFLLRKRTGAAESGAAAPRLWARRFWEHTIRDEVDLQRHVDYVHWNPVKRGWVERAAQWPYSTLHRYVRLGWLASDWGGPGTVRARMGE